LFLVHACGAVLTGIRPILSLPARGQIGAGKGSFAVKFSLGGAKYNTGPSPGMNACPATIPHQATAVFAFAFDMQRGRQRCAHERGGIPCCFYCHASARGDAHPS
jgi:hypothetical protein